MLAGDPAKTGFRDNTMHSSRVFAGAHATRAVALAAASLIALSAAGPALAANLDGASLDGAGADGAVYESAAESADAGGESILVTARRREEKLQDVPLAISAVNGAELNTQHLDRVGDYSIKVPSFGAVQQNTRVSGLYIRGLGGNASNDGAEGGVGLIVDNVFFTHVGFSWLDFVDLEGIEVVRGPQGTLLGKNTTIGAIIVRTAKPSFDPELKIAATVANRDRYQIRANATGPIIDDTLAYRLTYAKDIGGGYVRNNFDGAKYLDNNRWSVRGQLLFTPSSNVSSRLIVEHYETEEYNNYYPAVGDVDNNLNLDGTIHSVRAGSWTNKVKSLFGYTPSFDPDANANYDTQQRLVSRTDGVSNEINWDLGGVNLTSVTAWRRLYFRPYNDTDGIPFPILRNGFNVDVNQYSQELRLASDNEGFIDWTVGAYFLREKVRSDLHTIFYSGGSAFLAGPTLPSIVLDGVDYSKDGRLKVNSAAVFGQATLNFTDALSLTLGGRYTNEKKKVSVTGSYTGGAALPAGLAPFRAGVLAQVGGTTAAQGGIYSVSARNSRDSFAWLVNPALKVTENVLLYGSASYGEKSGAANTTVSPTTLNIAALTRPEKSLDYEAGIKTVWLDGRFTANINFYNNTIKDYQGAQINPAAPLLGSVLANVGKVRLRGFEFETSARPAEGISLSFNAVYNDGKYLRYDNAPAPIEYQVGLGGTAAVLSLTGYRISAPKWVVQGGIDFDQPIGGGLALTAYGNTSYRTKAALLNPRSIHGWQNAYAVVNAGIGIKAEDDSWSVLLWSKNLTDKRYAVGFGAASANSPIIKVQGDPRVFGLTVSGKF